VPQPAVSEASSRGVHALDRELYQVPVPRTPSPSSPCETARGYGIGSTTVGRRGGAVAVDQRAGWQAVFYSVVQDDTRTVCEDPSANYHHCTYGRAGRRQSLSTAAPSGLPNAKGPAKKEPSTTHGVYTDSQRAHTSAGSDGKMRCGSQSNYSCSLLYAMGRTESARRIYTGFDK
jgi:hypothetical protein